MKIFSLSAILCMILFTPGFLQAQAAQAPQKEPLVFSAEVSRKDGIFRCGEAIGFQFRLFENGVPASGKIMEYTLHKNGFPVETKRAPGDQTLKIQTSLDKPGWVWVRVFALNEKGERIKKVRGWFVNSFAGAMVEPEKLRQNDSEPADFDAFWSAQRKKLDQVPVREISRIPVEAPQGLNNRADHFIVTVACAGPKPLTGILSIPKNAKPHFLPAIAIFQGAGVYRSSFNRQYVEGAIILHVNAHGIPPLEKPEFYTALNQNELKNYAHQNKTDREKFYFNGMYLRVMRAFDYLKALPEWDGKRLISMGGSQGGAQSLAGAALDPAVTFCWSSVPAMGDHAGILAGRRPGWPGLFNNPKGDQKILKTAAYYDNNNFARRIRCEIIMLTGFSDFVCPPTSVYTAFHNLPETTRKALYTNPLDGHMTGNAEASRRIRNYIFKH